MRREVNAVVLVVFQLALVCSAMADELVLGVEQLPRQLNLLRGDTAANMVLRRALGATLISVASDEEAENGNFQLELSDGFRVDDGYREWYFRVRPERRFHSSALIRADDIQFSMERCRDLGLFRYIGEIAVERELSQVLTEFEWVKFVIQGVVDPQEVRGQFLRHLARCGVFEQESTEAFGQDFGYGTNVVGSGPYEVSSFRGGKEIVLTRSYIYKQADRGAPERLILRSVGDAKRGLHALRLGGIQALFTQDQGVMQAAQKDETLLASKCSIYNVVQRKGFQLPCKPEIEVTQLRYALR